MNNKKKIVLIALITTLILAIIGVAYAYFGLEVEGTGKDIVMDTGDLRLEYIDDQELSLVGATPGDSVSKTITVKNVGTREVAYTLYLGDLINTIENFELHITMECKSYKNYGTDAQEESGTCDRIYRAVPMSDTITSGTIKNNISIDVGITHEYNLTVSFDNKTYEQNYNKNKKFTGKIGIEEFKAPEPIYCTYDGELTGNPSFTKGIYTYTYLSYNWNPKLSDPTSTNPITEAPCTYINNQKITTMERLFYNSQASSIDVSNFNTSNVTKMNSMFSATSATEIKGLENLDTSNVTNMEAMFANSQVTSLDLSGFDTSKVTGMGSMFNNSKVTSLDLSNFDTSNVTGMSYMFKGLKLSGLDVSSLNTNNVTSMYGMFSNDTIDSLDLSNFDTSSVTNMKEMFSTSTMNRIDLSSFDTSNVTNMLYMFFNYSIPSLDLSSFNTSKVTTMYGMFEGNTSTVIYGLNKFNTSSVTNMRNMFAKSGSTTLDVSSFDTSNVTNMAEMFSGSNATEIKGLENFNTSKVTSMQDMFNGSKTLSLNLSSFDTSKVVSMGGMFASSKVKTLDLSNFDTGNVSVFEKMFYGCPSSEIKGLSNFNTSSAKTMNYMFSASGIESLDVSSFDTSNVKYMTSMFRQCKPTVLDVSSFDTSNVIYMDLMFSFNSNLKTIYVSDKFVTNNVTSGGKIFYGDYALVGGANTVFNKNNVDVAYARVDGGTSSPGYFTLKS